MADDTEDSDLIARAKSWFRDGDTKRSQWADEARECYKFRAGDQWSADDLEKLKTENRPAITFNRVGPIVNAVTGSEVSNRQEVRYIPREQGDAGVNEVLTSAAEWVRDECDAADEESDAFEDLVICGMGWTETRLDYETDPEGKIRIERVDPLEMYWDQNAKRKNLDDSRYVMRVRDIALTEAKAMFPDADESILNAGWAQAFGEDDGGKPHDATRARFYEQDNKAVNKDELCRIVEIQWWDRKPVWSVANRLTGKIETLEKDQYDQAKDLIKKSGMKAVKQWVRRYKRAFLGADVLEEGDSPVEGFTYRAMTGYRDRENGRWYGLVKGAIDPQRWANKWLSQSLNIMNNAAKGGLYVESGAIKNIRDFEQKFAQPGPVLELTNGGINRIKERTNGSAMPTGFEKAIEWGVNAIRDATGVSVEFQGLADRQQSGVLEYQRKQAAMNVLATLFDALRRYRKEQGRLLLQMIQKYISDGRLIRIVGENGNTQFVPLTKNPEVLEYDVIVDDAPDSPNQKEKVWAVIQTLMPVLQGAQVPPQLWAALLEYSPLPLTLTQEMSKILTGMAQQQVPPEVQKQMEDMGKQLEQTKQENVQLKDKRAESAMELQMDAQKQQHEMAMEEKRFQFDMQLEAMKAEHQVALERMKLQTEQEIQGVKLQLEQQKTAAQVDATKQKAEASSRKVNRNIKILRDPKTNKIVGADVVEMPRKSA